MPITANNRKASKTRRVFKHRRVSKQRSRRRANIGRAARRSKATVSRHPCKKYRGGNKDTRFTFNSWVKNPKYISKVINTEHAGFPQFYAVRFSLLDAFHQKPTDALRLLCIFFDCISFVLHTYQCDPDSNKAFTNSLRSGSEHITKRNHLVSENDYIEVCFGMDNDGYTIKYPAKVLSNDRGKLSVEYAIRTDPDTGDKICFTQEFGEKSEHYRYEIFDRDLFDQYIYDSREEGNVTIYQCQQKLRYNQNNNDPGLYKVLKPYLPQKPTENPTVWPSDFNADVTEKDPYYQHLLEEEIALHSRKSAYDAIGAVCTHIRPFIEVDIQTILDEFRDPELKKIRMVQDFLSSVRHLQQTNVQQLPFTQGSQRPSIAEELARSQQSDKVPEDGDILMQGFLKQGVPGSKFKRTRYFKLYPRQLIATTNESTTKVEETWNLQKGNTMCYAPIEHNKKGCKFYLRCTYKHGAQIETKFEADYEEKAQEWIRKILFLLGNNSATAPQHRL